MPCRTKFLTIKPIKKTTPRSGFLEQCHAPELWAARIFQMKVARHNPVIAGVIPLGKQNTYGIANRLVANSP